jgi:hypothetical protein
MTTDNRALEQRFAALERICWEQVERIERLEKDRNLAKFSYANKAVATLTETVKYEFESKLAPVRLVVGFRAKNRETGAEINCDEFTATQLERMAWKFARLFSPSRKFWVGKREGYGVMLKLFCQHGAIAQTHQRVWTWRVDPPVRREIATRIVAALPRKKP